METLYIIIADHSPLVRMGVSGLVNQLGYSLYIREITDGEKLFIALQKYSNRLAIISRSFLNSCSDKLRRLIINQPRQSGLILINDLPEETKSFPGFDETIELYDNEKTIRRKIEKLLRLISKPGDMVQTSYDISKREKEVLKLVAMGLTNKEIGEKLFISSHTVITHRKNISAKLGIKTIAGLTVYAVINRLIGADEIQ